jgi:hypothetical protein
MMGGSLNAEAVSGGNPKEQLRARRHRSRSRSNFDRRLWGVDSRQANVSFGRMLPIVCYEPAIRGATDVRLAKAAAKDIGALGR